jgi:hypothetical protein
VVVIIGLFDPVFQTPAAGAIVPVLGGALAISGRSYRIRSLQSHVHLTILLIVAVCGIWLTSMRVRDVWASVVYGYVQSVDSLERAARIVPDDYIVRFLAAQAWYEAGNCENALPHIRAALELYPSARAIQIIDANCRESLPMSSEEGVL